MYQTKAYIEEKKRLASVFEENAQILQQRESVLMLKNMPEVPEIIQNELGKTFIIFLKLDQIRKNFHFDEEASLAYLYRIGYASKKYGQILQKILNHLDDAPINKLVIKRICTRSIKHLDKLTQLLVFKKYIKKESDKPLPQVEYTPLKTKATISYSKFIIYTDEKIEYEGKPLDLEPRFVRLLEMFLEHPNSIVTFENITDRLGKINRTYVSTLSKKLRDLTNKDWITNKKGEGWKFNSE